MAATGVRLPELNVVVLSGRVTRDAEIFMTQSGLTKATVRIAVNRRVKDSKTGEWKDDVFYVDVIAWKELGERSKERAKKGVAVIVEGRLACREYEDKSGQKRTVFEVMANRIQYLSATGAGESEGRSGAPTSGSESIEEVPF